MKYCHGCKKTLPITDFNKDRRAKDGLQFYCKNCMSISNAHYYKKSRKDIRCIIKSRQSCKEYDDKIKLDVFNHYSNGKIECAVCKCNDYRVLNIDHVHGDGAKERKKLKLIGGAVFFRWLIKNDYPKGYRVLCRNCNWLEHLKRQAKTK